MSTALRLSRLVGPVVAAKKSASTANLLTRSLPAVATNTQQPSASIVSLAKQDESFQRPPPFDYKNKHYTRVHRRFSFLDPTYIRLNANSKIITVEGNMGSQKADFAKQLAEKFGWLYMPEPRVEDLFVNHNGFDYRTLNPYIHPKLQAIDEKIFYENPKHEGVSWLKFYFYKIRYGQYIDALAHLFNTGQGVVLERSPASDMVFTDAMNKNGWLPDDSYDYFYRLRYDTIHELLRPQLIIYLDRDPEVCLKHIKANNAPYITNSPVMTLDYLKSIEDSYKSKYLPDAAQYSELLVYKWNKPAENLDEVVNDIEKLNMDDWDIKGLKFKDWNFYWNELYDGMRYTYTTEKSELIEDLNQTPFWDVDSLAFDWNDAEHRDNVYLSMVPNWGIAPDYDYQRVGIFKRIFGRANKARDDEFWFRGPFF